MLTPSRRDLLELGALALTMPLLIGRASAAPTPSVAPAIPWRVKDRYTPIPFSDQQLGGLFAERMAVNLTGRMLRVDIDGYLRGFTHRNKGGDPEGDWVGEYAGKFIDAACQSLRYHDHPQLGAMTRRLVDTLIASQETDGYLGTYAAERRWKSWDVWVHQFNIDGLLSWYELTGDVRALAACRRMGDLICRVFGDRPGQRNILTAGLHGGMAATSILEPMCRLYRFSGDRRHLDFCHYVIRAYDKPKGPAIVTALTTHGSVRKTANAKAYEMILNLNGLIDVYRVTGEKRLLTAALNAWSDIVENQLTVTGTMSAGELFQPDGQLLTLSSSHVGETCVSVTWIQFNQRLLKLTGEAKYAQEIERNVYNHLLAAQNPRNGDFCYYTPLVGAKWFREELLCCVASGPRGVILLPQLVWGREGRKFVIQMYNSGQATFVLDGQTVTVKSLTDFPVTGAVMLTIRPERPIRFPLSLRVPEWAERFEARVGGERFAGRSGTMLEIDREWHAGDSVSISIELDVRAAPAGFAYPDYVAIQRGPQILTLEKDLNLDVSWLHRVGLEGAPRLEAVPVPGGWTGTQCYALEARVGTSPDKQRIAYHAQPVRLVPFAESVNGRIWVTRADRLPATVPPVTAFQEADLSEQKWLPEAEFLTDEDPRTFARNDPRNPRFSDYLGRPAGERGGEVWFSVKLDQDHTISRVRFGHGLVDREGGWFDTSHGKPRIEILKYERAQWQQVATIDGYPATQLESGSGVADWQAFEVTLPSPMTIHAIRVIGRSGGDFVSCAELSAFA